MIFKDCFPVAPVNQLIQVYRLRHFVIPEQFIITPKPYPTRPEQCIVFYVRGFELMEIPGFKKQKRSHCIISGQYTQRINRYSGTAEFLMVQAVMFPGMLHRLTGIPAHVLQNTFLDLEDIFPAEARQVTEQLENCHDYSEIITTIDTFLGRLMNKPKIGERPADAVFKLMLQHPCRYSMDWLAKEACLSTRQFERKALNYLGVYPKMFSRISRFIQSYDMKLLQPDLDWLSVAIACGYHDYQHLVKDYLDFADTRPIQLFIDEKTMALERRLGLKK